MPSINLNYFNPTSGLVVGQAETLTLEVGRNPDDGTEQAFLICTRGGSSSAAVKVDVSREYKTCIYGNGLNARPGFYMTRLTASEVGSSPPNTTLSVENSGAPTEALPRGLLAVADNPIAVVNYFLDSGLPHTVEYRIVTSVPGGTSIVVSEALDSTYNSGALVFNMAGMLPLFGTGRGSNKKDGAKSYLENPTAPTIATVWQASPAGILVTITPNSSILIRQRYQVYVRSSVDDFAVIEPHFVADATITSVVAATLVTTYDGGTAAGGGTLIGANSYNVLVTAEDYRGATGVPSLAKGSPASRLAFVAA